MKCVSIRHPTELSVFTKKIWYFSIRIELIRKVELQNYMNQQFSYSAILELAYITAYGYFENFALDEFFYLQFLGQK